MKTVIVLLMTWLLAGPSQSNAALVRAEFSGDEAAIFHDGVLVPPTRTFSGELIADWDIGVVTSFFFDIELDGGASQRFSIKDDYDLIEVSSGGIATQYWRDGRIIAYQLQSPESRFIVTRYQRLNDEMAVVIDPEWTMDLRLNHGRIIWSEDESIITTCGVPPYPCIETVREFSVYGPLELSSVAPVPLPPSFWFLATSVLGIAVKGMCKSRISRTPGPPG